MTPPSVKPRHLVVSFHESAPSGMTGGDTETAILFVAERVASPPGAVTVLNPGAKHGRGRKLALRFALDHAFESVSFTASMWRRLSHDSDVVLYTAPARSLWERLLLKALNWLSGTQFIGIPCHLTGLKTSLLRSIPFELNRNDVAFDWELTLQLMSHGAKVEELSQERQGGGRGWLGLFQCALHTRFHSMGVFSAFRYRRPRRSRYQNKVALMDSTHRVVLEHLARHPCTAVLDLGAGPGHVGRELVQRGMRVVGVDSEPEAEAGYPVLSWDLEKPGLPLNPREFEAVLLLDVLEHLSNPEEVLLSLRTDHGRYPTVRMPRVYLSTPNVAFLPMRLGLLFGRFSYGERGILDYGHRRLFTRRTFLRMLREVGYDVEKVVGVGAPVSLALDNPLGRFFEWVCSGLARALPAVFAYQFVVVARPQPSVGDLLIRNGVESVPRTCAPSFLISTPRSCDAPPS